MPNILTVKFPTSVKMTDHIEFETGRTFLSFQSEGSYGWVFVGSELENTNLEYTWEEEVEVPPTPVPTTGLYEVKRAVNIRLLPRASSQDIGDLAIGQTVEVLLADQTPENVGTHKYLWGKLNAIINPTEPQLKMLRDYSTHWVALKDGDAVWLKAIPSV